MALGQHYLKEVVQQEVVQQEVVQQEVVQHLAKVLAVSKPLIPVLSVDP